jgi:hypothetical protein
VACFHRVVPFIISPNPLKTIELPTRIARINNLRALFGRFDALGGDFLSNLGTEPRLRLNTEAVRTAWLSAYL